MEGHIEISTLGEGGQMVIVIKFVGDIGEHHVEEMGKQIEDQIQTHNKPKIILDLAEMHYANSKVIGYMTAWHMMTSKNLGIAAFVSAQPNVYDLIETQGLFNFIPYFPSLDTAVAALTN